MRKSNNIKKATILFAFIAIAMFISLMGCPPSAIEPVPTSTPTAITQPTVPAGYTVVYLDTTTFTGVPARVHMHTNNRLAITVMIDEIFGSATMAYTTDRTLIQTFEAVEDDGEAYFYDRTIAGNASLTANPGKLTFTITNSGDGYSYSGNIGAAGFDNNFIGFVIDTASITTLQSLIGQGTINGEGAIRFEYMDANGVQVYAALDIATYSIAAATPTPTSTPTDSPVPTPTPLTTAIPSGYSIVYLNTSAFSASAVRMHMHTNNRLAVTVMIEEIFSNTTATYTAGRTLIQTFEAEELDGEPWFWDRTITGNASLSANPGKLTLTITNSADAYVYSGNIGAAGFTNGFIGIVIDDVGLAAIQAAVGQGAANGEAAIRFEYVDAGGATVYAATDIATYVP